jgi:hypothetical protein
MPKRLLIVAIISLTVSNPVWSEDASELQQRMASGICRSDYELITPCDFSKVCKQIEDFRQNQACQQECSRREAIEDKYNSFVRQCRSSQDSANRSQSAPAPTVQAPKNITSGSDDIDARLQSARGKSSNYGAQVEQQRQDALKAGEEASLEDQRRQFDEAKRIENERRATIAREQNGEAASSFINGLVQGMGSVRQAPAYRPSPQLPPSPAPAPRYSNPAPTQYSDGCYAYTACDHTNRK